MKNEKDKKPKEQEEATPTCDKNNPADPHYGQAGDYTIDCIWIPDVGEKK